MSNCNVAQKTSTGTTLMPIDTQEFHFRTVWVEGEIGLEKSTDFVKQIVELNREDSAEPIKVLICSYGGSVIHGLAMYDAIVSSKAPVETYCIGTAYSMAAVLFAAGKKRYMMHHSKLMLHEPLVETGAGGTASSVKALSESLEKTKNQIMNILCQHTNKTKKEMNKAMEHDTYFTAEEAIRFGLADTYAEIGDIVV